MDNFLINMTLATCDGWIMDNLPIIMTLGSPRPLLGMQGALGEGWGGHIRHTRPSILHN